MLGLGLLGMNLHVHQLVYDGIISKVTFISLLLEKRKRETFLGAYLDDHIKTIEMHDGPSECQTNTWPTHQDFKVHVCF